MDNDYSNYGELIKINLSSAPFPHPLRCEGHTYNQKFFPADKHYSDSSVAVFIPKGFKPGNKTDFVVYFHGWYNNIDTALSFYKLADQFSSGGKNAILIFPEGPRNAPDSFGGKLEDEGGFKRFMNDVTSFLVENNKITSKETGNIILAGHSGAYHVISFILNRGEMTENIKEVFLFDALYGQTEKFTHWITHNNGRLINIYTEDGGTKEETLNLISDLKGWNIPFISKNEDEITLEDLKNNRLVFIYTKLTHNEVVHINRQFEKFLKASSLAESGHAG